MLQLDQMQCPLGVTPRNLRARPTAGLNFIFPNGYQLVQELDPQPSQFTLVQISSPSLGSTLVDWPDLRQSIQPQIAFVELVSSPVSSESLEMRWLREHRDEVDTHRGEWLLIGADGLLASNADFRLIKSEIERSRIASPFVYYVPTESESRFVML